MDSDKVEPGKKMNLGFQNYVLKIYRKWKTESSTISGLRRNSDLRQETFETHNNLQSQRWFNFSKILLKSWSLQPPVKMVEHLLLVVVWEATQKINDVPKSHSPSVLCPANPSVRNTDAEMVPSAWTCLPFETAKPAGNALSPCHLPFFIGHTHGMWKFPG